MNTKGTNSVAQNIANQKNSHFDSATFSAGSTQAAVKAQLMKQPLIQSRSRP